MFFSFDTKSFGQELKKIRQETRLTQSNVSSLTGINTITLRRIENGLVIPKQETLELLSHYYKKDLSYLFLNFRSNKSLLNIYQKLDEVLFSNSLDTIKEFLSHVEQNIDKEHNDFALLINEEKHQISLLLKGILYYNDSINFTVAESIDILVKAIKLTLPNFSLNRIKEFKYNVLEGRALLFISLNYVKQEKIEESNEILLYLLGSVMKYNDHYFKLHLKIISNISYNFHRLDAHWNALLYAEKGLQIALKENSIYCLTALLSRKGIALYLLGKPNFLKPIEQSITLLEINHHYKLAEQFRKIFKEKYNIHL